MLFKVKRQLSRKQQGNMPVCEYSIALKRLRDELFFLRPTPECRCGVIEACDCNAFKICPDIIEEDKPMEFLSGLNEQYEHVINQILLLEPLPTVNKAFYMTINIEKHKENVVDNH